MKTRYYHKFINSVLFLCGFMLHCIFAGCGSAPQNISTNELKMQASNLAANQSFIQNSAPSPGDASGENGVPDYKFASGDSVEIKFFYTPELNEIQTIRPEGKISLQMVGEVTAAGKTPAQLREELINLYSKQLQNPEISVSVKTFYNRRVYVGGQVMRPGVIAMPGRLTALEAVMEAGGLDFREADVHNIVVIRHSTDKRYGYLLDIDPALNGQETVPFFLEPQDIVFVPQTKIAKFNQWLDQHVNKIIPQTGFFFARQYGDTTIGVDTSAR